MPSTRKSARQQGCTDARLRRGDDWASAPLFALVTNEEAGTVAYDAPPISDCAIEIVIGRVQGGFAKRQVAAPGRKSVRMDDLPPALQEEAVHRQQLDLGKAYCSRTSKLRRGNVE